MRHTAWWPLLELLSRYPVMQLSLCNSFDDQALVDKIYGCLIFNSLRPSHEYICVSNLTIFGSDNGLLPGWCHATIWTNDGILLTGSLETNNEIAIEIHTFSFKTMHLKGLSVKWRPFWLSLNVLTELLWLGFKDRAAGWQSQWWPPVRHFLLIDARD